MLISLLLFTFFLLVNPIVSILRKHRKAYLQAKISRALFIRNTTLEIFGILFAMVLAGLLGRHVALIVATQISNNLIRIMAGFLIGILVGACAGLLVKYTWGRWVKA